MEETDVSMAASLGPILSLRKAAQRFLATLPDDAKVVLDFAGVEFASRSFCDELLQGMEARRHGYQVVNANQSISSMLAMVTRQRQRSSA